ncbi:MAG: rhodanese-like domain-containing protein [Patescibacteria group bacterium]
MDSNDFISAKDLYKRIQNKENFVLLDVRTPDEFKRGYIKGAVLLNLSENFLADLNKIGISNKKNEPIVVYCRSGSRSQILYSVLKTLSFTNVKDLEGGLLSWKKENLPLII